MLLLLGAFIGYAILAFHAPPTDHRWLFDAIDGIQQLAIDDAYRYFAARGAWHDSSLWHWMYVLPGNLAYEGLLVVLFDGQVLPIRLIHIAVSLVGVFFVYLACLHLEVRKWLAWLVVTSFLLMPIFMVISMSFYGESLLTMLLAATYYYHLKGRRYLVCLFGGLAPLAQLPGLYLTAPFFVWYAWRRDWKVFFLLALPGFLYFLNILFHQSLLDYFSLVQLHKLYPALPTTMNDRPWWVAVIFLNPLLLVLAAAGAVRMCRVLPSIPVFAGAFCWFLLICVVMTPRNGYEPRYLVPCLPAIMMAFACLMEWLLRRQTLWPRLVAGGAVVLVVLVTVENLGQSDPIRNHYMGERRWPLAGEKLGPTHFYRIESTNMQLGEDVARRMAHFLKQHAAVELVMVSDYRLFYYLDPVVLPVGVRVCYTPFTADSVYYAFGGSYFCMSSKAPYVAFYNLFPGLTGSRQALYVGDFSWFGWQPAYQNRLFKVYETNYKIVAPPNKIYILQRENELDGRETEVHGNLCPGEQGYVCPDWRIFGFPRID